MVNHKGISVMVDIVTPTGEGITIDWAHTKSVGKHKEFWYVEMNDGNFIFLDKKSSVKVLELIQKDGLK